MKKLSPVRLFHLTKYFHRIIEIVLEIISSYILSQTEAKLFHMFVNIDIGVISHNVPTNSELPNGIRVRTISFFFSLVFYFLGAVRSTN